MDASASDFVHAGSLGERQAKEFARRLMRGDELHRETGGMK
jgi:hypothetical protein